MKLQVSLDRLPELLGRVYAKLTGWSPEGKQIVLQVVEGEPEMFGTVVSGTIVRVDVEHASECRSTDAGLPLLVRLNVTWEYKNRSTAGTSWVLVIPLSWGQGPYRLPIAAGQVHVFPATAEGAPTNLKWQDMIAVCELRLKP
jgi:hypothetical protein